MGIKTFGRIGLASLLIISQFVGIASLTLKNLMLLVLSQMVLSKK